LDELEGKAPNSPAVRNSSHHGSNDETSKTDGGKRTSRSKRRSSVSDGAESLSRSASDSSVSNPKGGNAGDKNENVTTPLHSHG
jgi:hypothetical protein